MLQQCRAFEISFPQETPPDQDDEGQQQQQARPPAAPSEALGQLRPALQPGDGQAEGSAATTERRQEQVQAEGPRAGEAEAVLAEVSWRLLYRHNISTFLSLYHVRGSDQIKFSITSTYQISRSFSVHITHKDSEVLKLQLLVK